MANELGRVSTSYNGGANKWPILPDPPLALHVTREVGGRPNAQIGALASTMG